jgi:hypothetical protein
MKIIDIEEFAKTIADILDSDRDAIIVQDGFKGEGKTVFMFWLGFHISQATKTSFDIEDNFTWQRSELQEWINPGPKQKSLKSVVVSDELVGMFYAREWQDNNQIDGLKLLNMCRDRHLCVMGAIPNFWELDINFRTLTLFWVHIHERGRAWVFRQSDNPGARDKWYKSEVEKSYFKNNNPYASPTFICEIHFPDWPGSLEERYYAIRNVKRLNIENQRAERNKEQMKENIKHYKESIRQKDRQVSLLVKGIMDITEMKKENIGTFIGLKPEEIQELYATGERISITEGIDGSPTDLAVIRSKQIEEFMRTI